MNWIKQKVFKLIFTFKRLHIKSHSVYIKLIKNILFKANARQICEKPNCFAGL